MWKRKGNEYLGRENSMRSLWNSWSRGSMSKEHLRRPEIAAETWLWGHSPLRRPEELDKHLTGHISCGRRVDVILVVAWRMEENRKEQSLERLWSFLHEIDWRWQRQKWTRMQHESRAPTLLWEKVGREAEKVRQFHTAQTSQSLCSYRFYFLPREKLFLGTTYSPRKRIEL